MEIWLAFQWRDGEWVKSTLFSKVYRTLGHIRAAVKMQSSQRLRWEVVREEVGLVEYRLEAQQLWNPVAWRWETYYFQGSALLFIELGDYLSQRLNLIVPQLLPQGGTATG